jgi:hypothetical protein
LLRKSKKKKKKTTSMHNKLTTQTINLKRKKETRYKYFFYLKYLTRAPIEKESAENKMEISTTNKKIPPFVNC